MIPTVGVALSASVSVIAFGVPAAALAMLNDFEDDPQPPTEAQLNTRASFDAATLPK